jgi:putative Ca2+/H+ antiporter (TMEM165/GDT1 family)
MLAHMDWKLWASTFVAVFLAELGDKTQLATFSVASSNASARLTVFTASASALVATSALAVVVGGLVSKAVPPVWVKRAAGALFIAIGVLYLSQTFGPPKAEAPEGAAPSRPGDRDRG